MLHVTGRNLFRPTISLLTSAHESLRTSFMLSQTFPALPTASVSQFWNSLQPLMDFGGEWHLETKTWVLGVSLHLYSRVGRKKIFLVKYIISYFPFLPFSMYLCQAKTACNYGLFSKLWYCEKLINIHFYRQHECMRLI